MKFYLNLIVWILSGLIIGSALSLLLLQQQSPPHLPPANVSVPSLPEENTTPQLQANGTVNLTIINAPDCSRCTFAELLSTQLETAIAQNQDLSVAPRISLDYTSAEAKAIVSRYNITVLPALLVSMPQDADPNLISAWVESIGTMEEDNVLVSRLAYPPYYNVSAGQVVGIVSGIAIGAENCIECASPSLYFEALEAEPFLVAFEDKKILEENSEEARQLITQLNITKLPALIVSSDISVYPFYPSYMSESGSIIDGWFVMREIMPPYVDLNQNHSIRGMVDAVYLVNRSCAECFDVTTLSSYISDSAGLAVINSTTYDINSPQGNAAKKKYNITSIPTLLYSPEVSVYPGFSAVWLAQNNSIESDGWHIFRNYALLGENMTYQNISG